MGEIWRAFTTVVAVFYAIFVSFLAFFVKPKRKSIHGEVAVITGGAGGIGRETAYLLGARGAKVVILDINKAQAEETAEEIRDGGGIAFVYECDVSKADQVRTVAGAVKVDVGDVSILINNAGILISRGFLDAKPEEMLRMFNINVFAQFWTVKEFLPSMVDNNHGHIVNIASLAGIVPSTLLSDYTATKFAVVGFTKSLRRDLILMKKTGVKVTTVCPHLTETPLGYGYIDKVSRSRMFRLIPPLQADEVAKATMEGILTEQEEVCIPGYIRYGLDYASLLPTAAQDAIDQYLTEGMEM